MALAGALSSTRWHIRRRVGVYPDLGMALYVRHRPTYTYSTAVRKPRALKQSSVPFVGLFLIRSELGIVQRFPFACDTLDGGFLRLLLLFYFCSK